MSFGDDFKNADDPQCQNCAFFHALPSPPAGYAGTCNLNPPQVVSHEDEFHYVFPAVAAGWYCGHFSPKP